MENKALPKFYAISGCDKTGCLNSKGKMSYWKVFDAASDKQIVDFAKLARTTSADHLTLDHLT